MIAVHEIKIVNTHDKKYYHDVYWHDSPVIGIYHNPEKDCAVEVTKETIKGRRFVNYYGIEIVIGWSQQVQTVLGLPFEVFQNQNKRRMEDYEENTRLRKKLREYKEMSVFKLVIKKIRGLI